MEENINLIKEKLTGNYSEDVEYLNTLYNVQAKILQDTLAQIEAINSVLEEITVEEEKKEGVAPVEEEQVEEQEEQEVSEPQEIQSEEDTRTDEEKEIDSLIDELINNLDNESDEEALANIEKIIPRIEAISKKDDENTIYCSFTSDFEKMIFERIFGGDKQVKATPYANDVVYVMYSDLLLKKKRRKAAMDALDRAIYWNFLNRQAREKKIDLYYSKQEIVKCLEAIKKLQSISYTAQDIADCYNKYAYVFNSLKDTKSAYALYRLSYSYFQNENVLEVIRKFEEENPDYKEISSEELLGLAEDNEVEIGPNANIIKAHRDITRELIEAGAIKEAKIMIENDYSMTKDDEIANIYNQLTELENSQAEATRTEKVEETEEEVAEEPVVETKVGEEPKKETKKADTKEKTTTKKNATKGKKTTTKTKKTTK